MLRSPVPRARRLAFTLVAALAATVGTLSTSAASFDLRTATLEDINRAYDAGALSAEKLLTLYLARIAAYDRQGPKLNTIITLNPHAQAEARALDAERKARGPRSRLHGVPVVVKDLIDTKDMPTSAGFLPLKNSQPLHDATIIARLRDAGAIILAKVNLSDWFGTPPPGDHSTILGRTLNPYNLALKPGGSSGGTAVALAAGFAQLGLGSESGTSIREPASNNSVVGFAPTRGLISRTGVLMHSFTQDRAGPMARSVYDVAAMTDVLAGLDAEDLLTASSPGRTPTVSYTTFLHRDGLRGARIGVFRDLFRPGARHAEGIALIERAIGQMKSAGATVVDGVSTGLKLFALLDGQGARANYWEAPFSYDLYFRRLGPQAPIRSVDELIAKHGPQLRAGIAKARTELRSLQHDPDYLTRRDTQETVKDAVIELMSKFRLDALVYPYRSLSPEPHLENFRREADNALSAVTGLPTLVVPAGYTEKENGPIAIEILGRPYSEPVLFRIAYAYEQASARRKPPATTPALAGEVFDY